MVWLRSRVRKRRRRMIMRGERGLAREAWRRTSLVNPARSQVTRSTWNSTSQGNKISQWSNRRSDTFSVIFSELFPCDRDTAVLETEMNTLLQPQQSIVTKFSEMEC